MKKSRVKVVRGKKWQIEKELVLKEDKMYVLKNEKLRVEIIQLHYNTLVTGHERKWKTMELVIRNYWWPGVTKDIGKYVEECDVCQKIKNRMEISVGKLKLSEVPEKPQIHLMVDFIMKLLLVAGKYAILVVCNRLSKMAYFIATTKETLAEELVRLFRDNVWKLYRLPESIVSDKGPQFAAEMTRELNSMLEIETKLSIAFYPQTDGQTERINQKLKQYLRFFIDHRQKDQPEWLALAEFAINNKIHLTTKVSLFMANYGREIRMGVDLRRKGKMEKATEFAERMRKVQKKTGAVLMRAQEKMKRQVDRGRKKAEV